MSRTRDTDHVKNKKTKDTWRPERKATLISKAKEEDKDGGERSPRKVLRICHICGSDQHFTRQNRFEKKGQMTFAEVKEKCRRHNLCFKCALPMAEGHRHANECTNVTRACFYCQSDQHVNVLCSNREGAHDSNNAPSITPAPLDQ